MSTKILNDIHNDVKLLITEITGFTEGEEGFRRCESFALSNVKHHRYLSVDAGQTSRMINEMVNKFAIHGKYELTEKFRELVDVFLSSFDFEHHPQCDLQWSLLSLLLNLSSDAHELDLNCLNLSTRVPNLVSIRDDPTDGFDWKNYLKQGEEKFFNDYGSDDESLWSDDEDQFTNVDDIERVGNEGTTCFSTTISLKRTQSTLDQLSQSLSDEVESRNWLKNNVQNGWWNVIGVEERDDLSDSRRTIWDRIVEQELCSIKPLSEYKACREILWLCHAQVPTVLFESLNDSDVSVRQNIRVSSLSQTAMNNLLTPLCNHFEILRELEQFGDKLYTKHDSPENHRRPSLTYETYYAALRRQLNKMREPLIEIEKHLVRQGDSYTLLRLLDDLKGFLRGIRMLYNVHRSVTNKCWENEENWRSASKLLSNLFFQLENANNRDIAELCANLYLESLSVYLNIIDTWLGEGRLEDWTNEFVIFKVSEDIAGSEALRKGDPFVTRQLDPICVKDPIMQLLLDKIQHKGKSIELLASLDRIPDMWRSSNCNSKVHRNSLYKELMNEVTLESSRYDSKDATDAKDTTDALEIISSRSRESIVATTSWNEENLERNVFQQMSSMKDPFLLKAYEAYLPRHTFREDDVVDDGKHIGFDNADTPNRVKSQPNGSILPSTKILRDVLSKIFDARYEGASKLVKNIMMTEYKLEKHSKLMRSVYTMETGYVINKFCELLFTEIESNQSWNNENYLTNLMDEILSSRWPESMSSRWFVTIDEVRTNQVLIAVDRMTLRYAIDWPLSMIYEEEALAKYNQIFKLQLKFRWALWALNNLRFSDLEGPTSSDIMEDKLVHFHARRLESVRFWLIHAIGSIHSYISGQVVQQLGLILEKALIEASNLDAIIQVHNEYLTKVYEHCLLTADFQDLIGAINSLLELCIHVREQWKHGASNLIARELDKMESNYVKHHTYLALALHNAVRHKDADYLTGLSSAFNHSIPFIS